MADGHLAPGTAVGRYQVLGLIGRGAMGEVYAAYHPDLDRRIALKVVHESGPKSEERRARLLREARAIARFAHPNVVAVHDAGTFGEHVYIAMEFVDGKTVYDWLLTPRSWREVLDVFLAAGRGLAAAHAADVVHRDFKPENVMVGKDGAVKVMDFGLARLVEEASGDDSPSAAASLAAPAPASAAPTTMTKTGAVLGTPAYMSPEQFRGQRGDAKSDQFSFCVALYEALYGERPFAGDDVLTLSSSVTLGELRPLPKERPVPPWLRRVVARGLRTKPDGRWPSMAALVDGLEDDPALRRRRRLVVAGSLVLVAVTMLVTWRIVARRGEGAEHEIARYLQAGENAVADIRGKLVTARELRQRSLNAFDVGDDASGETLWQQARALVPGIDAGYEDAARAFESARTLDKSRDPVARQLADLRRDHYLFAEDFRLANRMDVLFERLVAADADGSRRRSLTAPGTMTLRTNPTPERATLERYLRDPMTRRRDPTHVGTADPRGSMETLIPGSYRLVLEGRTLARVVYPFEVRRGEQIRIDLTLPPASAIPDGFVYVPPGEFWFGEADEDMRTDFLATVPIHRRRTDAYLIAQHETTYAEWIAFLEALPASERARHMPGMQDHFKGGLQLRQIRESDVRNTWELSIQPGAKRYVARSGDPITYLGRRKNSRQDWTRFPVGAVTFASVNRYAAWKNETGAILGARPCTELEWERAARGSDDRVFPHGDRLEGEDANFDRTYGRVDAAYGPDVVGLHPASRSPFGVDDLAGNLFELTSSVHKSDALVIRGGAYYFSQSSNRSTNREAVPVDFRGGTTGVRLCASFPAASSPDPIDTARTQGHRR